MDEKERNKQISWELKRARKRAGISAKDAAAYLGFSEVSLFRMEDGQSMVSAARLEDLAKYYQVSLPDLLLGRLVTMPSTVDVQRMKAVVSFVQHVIQKLKVKPSPEKIADVVANVYETEIERIIRDPASGSDFNTDYHTEFVEMIFRK
ncbi:helix-turn-helix transcriptional regulator [Planktotalea sp.]|uniref:helix-turn-helix domain-containing protein n=1 Tax=Planktotalea sp. TaxID=2029877 RepID=UPI0032999190